MSENAIHFSTVPCDLGWLLVACTRRGVCNVRFGDDPDALEDGLRAEFPFAEVCADPPRLARWVEALLRAAEGLSPGLEVPLDVRGSQFQRRVWQAILAIPRGQTRSYAQLARAIGRPGAARAVARACATNPVAVAIPCHRVVPQAGGGGGYRWGVERKRVLLEREGGSSRSEGLRRKERLVASGTMP